MKKYLAMILALVMALSLVACGDKKDDSADNSDGDTASGRVYWLNFKPEADEALQKVAAMYTEKTGVPVTVVTAASGTYNETLTAEMDKSAPPTLFVVGNQAAVDTWGDYCYDLSGTAVANELNTDAYNLYDADGKLCSIGYCYECYGIIVNEDLLEKAGYTLGDITNFETLKAVAEDIHARASELGFDAFTSSSMSDDSSWRFTGHLANLEYYYESVDDPDAWKECPSSIKGTYMQNYKNLWDLYINNSAVNPADLAAGGFDAADEFGKEQAVFYQNGSWEWAKLTGTGDGQYGLDNLSMIPFYCGVAGEENAGLNCGTENCWAVNAKASEEDIQATLEFMNWMVTDPEVSRMLVDEFAAMPYKQAAESTNGFLADANDYTTNGNYIMPWVTNFQPNVDAYRAALVSAMNQYDADQSDANWELVKTPIDWDTKDVILSAGQIDCIWNGFTMTGREDSYTFSVPYIDNSIVVVTLDNSGINTLADLKDKTVVAQAGSSALSALEDPDGAKDLADTFKELQQTPDYNTAMMNLKSGLVDAVAIDIGVAQYYLSQQG